MNPYLFDLLHQVSVPLEKPQAAAKVIDRFTIAYEAAIKKKVEELINDQLHENKYLSREQLSEKIEREVRQASDLSEFGTYIFTAVHIFRSEGTRYLEKEAYFALVEGLNQLSEKINQLNLENLSDDDIYGSFEVLLSSSYEILKIGTSKFDEGLVRDSLAIFSFLTLVQSKEPDFWYRMGLVAQKDNNIELALKAFGIAQELNPQLIGPHIYAAECLFNKGLNEEALEEVKLAKSHKTNEEEWSEEISAIEALLAPPESISGV